MKAEKTSRKAVRTASSSNDAASIGRKQRTDIGEEILVRELVEYAFFGLRGADKMGRPAQNASVLENELADSSIQ